MIVYRIRNSCNKKVYIGITSQKLNIRWNRHRYEAKRGVKKIALYNAIRKYGIENFSIESIDTGISYDDLKMKESRYIIDQNSLVPNGYNMILISNERQYLTEDDRKYLSKQSQGIKSSRSKNNFIGVKKNNNCRTFLCTIRYLGKLYYKSFLNEIDAVEAYDKMALYLYGETAKINFAEKLDYYLSLDLESFFDFNEKIKRAQPINMKGFSIFINFKQEKYYVKVQDNITKKIFSIGKFDKKEDALDFKEKQKELTYDDLLNINSDLFKGKKWMK